MKVLSIISVILVFILFSVFVLLQLDDELSPTAKEWVSTLDETRKQQSLAFIYLHGMIAPENDDVLSVGQQWFSAYKKAEDKVKHFDDSIEYVDVVKKRISKPSIDNKLYCQLRDQGCLGRIVNLSEKWNTELEKHHVLLARYKTYLDFSDYATLSKPLLSEVMPDYTYLKIGHRLSLLNALKVALDGESDTAINELVKDISRLRKQLVMADNIIHKVFFTRMVSNTLEVLIYISEQDGLNKNIALAKLSKSELSMKTPLIREFVMGYYLYKGMDKNPDFFTVGGNTPEWYVKTIFKPNMTINSTAENYKKVIALSELSPESFASYDFKSKQENITFNFRNYAGSVLNNIAGTNFNRYVSMLHDLNCKITFTNHVLEGGSAEQFNACTP